MERTKEEVRVTREKMVTSMTKAMGEMRSMSEDLMPEQTRSAVEEMLKEQRAEVKQTERLKLSFAEKDRWRRPTRR